MPRKGQKLTEAQKGNHKKHWASLTDAQKEKRIFAMRNLSPAKERLRRKKLSKATSERNKLKLYTRKIIFTPSMVSDLNLMGDNDFSKKWNVSRNLIIRRRKELGIKPFNNQHGIRAHRIEGGIEYKWCQHGHWEQVASFGKHTRRWDGLRGWCKKHEHEKAKQYYVANDKAVKIRRWTKTPSGRLSKRATWRKQTAKKKAAYVQWSVADEKKLFALFKGSCAYCGTKLDISTCEFDHFVPMSSGGLTEPSNMVPCCISCNRGSGGKFNQDPKTWLITKFLDGQNRFDSISVVLTKC